MLLEKIIIKVLTILYLLRYNISAVGNGAKIMYDIEFYEDINGKSEVYEYISELKKTNNKENKQKIKIIINLYC